MNNNFNRFYYKGCPCRQECEKRHPACHEKCPDFRKWRKELDEIQKEEQKKVLDPISDAVKKKMWKNIVYRKKQKIGRVDYTNR